MAWLELRMDTTPEAIDWVNSSLAATPYAGEVRVTEYEPPGAGEASNWAYTVRLYLPDDAQADRQIGAIERQLSSLYRTGLVSELQVFELAARPAFTTETSPLHRVGKRFVILTGNEPAANLEHEIVIRLENSFAFGSGLHPATMLSLNLLEQYVQPAMQVLDLGSGTGILGVAMAKLGAQVLAIDNDPISVQASQQTVELNQVSPQVTVMQASLGSGSEMGHWMGLQSLAPVACIAASDRFDLIAANVLGRIHIALARDYRQALRCTPNHAGVVVTSGFNTDYEREIMAAFAEVGLEAIDRRCLDEWVALVHQVRD